MSAGSRVVPIRFPRELEARVLDQLAKFERTRRGVPLTVSGFVRRAVVNELAHLERSRRKGVRRGGCITPGVNRAD